MGPKSLYPWFFFYRIAKLILIIFIPTLFVILFFYRSSYRSGLVSQLSEQMDHDLRLIQHTLAISNIDWNQWCKSLPHQKDSLFSLVDSNIEKPCYQNIPVKHEYNPSLVTGGLSITREIEVKKDLILKKTIPAASLRSNLDQFDRVLFLRIVPFAMLSYFIFIFLFYQATKPLGVILSKVQKFKDDIPFKKNLAFLYEKNEWVSIEEALNKADLN